MYAKNNLKKSFEAMRFFVSNFFAPRPPGSASVCARDRIIDSIFSQLYTRDISATEESLRKSSIA